MSKKSIFLLDIVIFSFICLKSCSAQEQIVAVGSDVTLVCEHVSQVEKCTWISPEQCCYGDICGERRSKGICRSEKEWKVEKEGEECRLTIKNISEEEDGSVEGKTWKCDVGSGDIFVRLTVATSGKLYWGDSEKIARRKTSLKPSISVSGNEQKKHHVSEIFTKKVKELQLPVSPKIPGLKAFLFGELVTEPCKTKTLWN